jgi:hypothetical protein
MDTANNLLGGGSSDSEKYNKDTYIGFLKMKNGGMKIIPGDKDEKILATRNKILGHLDKVLSGGKDLKEKNIEKYFKALGGKFVRNDMCISGDNSNCKGGKNVSVAGAHKLLKLISKKNLPVDTALETFKGSAPELYEKLETKIKGGYKAVAYDDSDSDSDSVRGSDSNDSDSSKRGSPKGDSPKRDSPNSPKRNSPKRDSPKRSRSSESRRYNGGDKSSKKSNISGVKAMEFNKEFNIVNNDYSDFFQNKDNKKIRDDLINELEDDLRSYKTIDFGYGIIYMGALDGLFIRNKLCDLKNWDDCDKIRNKAIILGKKLRAKLTAQEESNKIGNRPYRDTDEVFNEYARNLSCAMRIRDDCPEERKGGYERDYYHDERRGGLSEERRNYYPEERRGGYPEERRDYYLEERRGGYLYERDYYPNEMHGGNLGLFRNEIERNISINLNNLRDQILNIDL